MAALDDLIAQVEDETLRARLAAEVQRTLKQKKFGLVFEEHLPESTLLYDVAVKKEGLAARNNDGNDLWRVLDIQDGQALCQRPHGQEQETIPLTELTAAAEFGEPIYPYLEPLDSVENAPDSDLWHTLIEADNYHALQLLEYMYAGKVDAIYIDPPYNSGAKDWKYNNNYVDGNDQYRHSKWLSMMKRRLRLAKQLLNPNDSVLIATIDEKEYLHLGCLLEEMFPESNMQMVSITINPSGAKRDNLFSRSDEYAFVVFLGNAKVNHPTADTGEKEVRWWYLRRTDFSSRRGTVKGGTAQFYPIYVNDKTKKIVHIGSPLTPSESRFNVPTIDGATPVFPVRDDGVEMNWGVTGDSLDKLIKEGVVRVSEGSENQPYVFRYLSANYKSKVKNGRWAIKGLREDGTKIVVEVAGKVTRATTVWQDKLYDAGQYGTSLLKQFVGSGRFSFPKSLYSVRDTLWYFVSNKPNALVLDFFAGSGTTLHAINLLNAEDDGNRRCIVVTNNEVSEAEAKSLINSGHKPGDEAWNKLGIARYVTWPRTVCSIEGHDVNGQPLKGNYLGSDRPMADGFSANANFFHLGFLDKQAVKLGTQLEKLLPVLWMKAGAIGKCPLESTGEHFLLFPANKFAVLTDVRYTYEFTQAMQEQEYQVAYIVTDYEDEYRRIINNLQVPQTFQLYRDYLDNFTINTRTAR